MPAAKKLSAPKDFMSLCREAQQCLSQIMTGTSPATVLAGKNYMSWDNRIAGLSKLNVFSVALQTMYDQIKNHDWGKGESASEWKGFRIVATGDAYIILTKNPPAKPLPGGTTYEVAGYEKQPDDKYYSKDEPSLNLEFKYNSGELSFAQNTEGVFIGKPKESWCINLHVKQVKDLRDWY